MKLSSKNRDRVLQATVQLPTKGGRGVLVAGGFILTAAHCVTWDGDGDMALGEYFMEMVETHNGHRLLGSVCAADPVADIAVLNAPDSQEQANECDAFEAFVAATEPVLLRTEPLPEPRLVGKHPKHTHVPVWILNRKHEWIEGTVTRYSFSNDCPSKIALHAGSKIEGGDSGSPVVDAKGRLIGVISWCGEQVSHKGAGYDGAIPIAGAAPPVWVVKQIAAAEARPERIVVTEATSIDLSKVEAVPIDLSSARAVPRGTGPSKPRKKPTLAERQARARGRVARLRQKQMEQ